MDAKKMQKLMTLHHLVLVLVEDVETKSESRKELMQIKKDFKRGMYNYRDVERCVNDVVVEYFGDYIGLTDDAVVIITSDILFNSGFLTED